LGSPTAPLDNQCALRVESLLCTVMFNTSIPIAAQEIDSQTVDVRVDDSQQLGTHFNELCSINQAFEYGILDALPIIETNLRRPAKPPFAAVVNGRNIVRDQYLHAHTQSFPEKCGIGVDVSAKMARQEAGLQVRHESPGDFLPKEWMQQLIALSLLPFHKHLLA